MLLNKLIFLTNVVILNRYILEQNGTYYAQLSKEEALQDEGKKISLEIWWYHFHIISKTVIGQPI